MKKTLSFLSLAIFLFSCASETKKEEPAQTSDNALKDIMTDTTQYADNDKGIGKFTDVQIDPKLDEKMAAMGTGIYDLKCASCHKLNNEKLVGPGWEGVTKRRTAAWIMNFVTNVDEMLDKDPEAQAMLETCLVRMPNQNLSDDDARHVYEYMRKNDGVN